MQPLPLISRGRSLKENAQKWFWGKFFVCSVVFFLCMNETKYLKLDKKSTRFSNTKGKSSQIADLLLILLKEIKAFTHLLFTSTVSSASKQLWMWLSCFQPWDVRSTWNFLARISASWRLTCLSFEQYHSRKALGTQAISFELTETTALLKATTSCKSTAEEAGDVIIMQCDIFIKI